MPPPFRFVDQIFGHVCVWQHSQRMVGLGNCLPTGWVLITEFDQVRLDKHFRLVCFEEKGLAILGLGVTAQDQIDDFLLVRQCILPASKACRAKGRNALRMRLNLLF